ncbi:MAG: NUDIX hydrolase [bacterium]
MTQKKIYKGKIVQLSLNRKKLPGGYVADIEVVHHPGAVLIVPHLNRERIVFIRQYRPVIDEYIWELPAGTLKRNETPLECAKREMEEEIGYAAKRWKRIGMIYPAPGYTTEKIYLFTAKQLTRVGSRRDQDEIIRPRSFSKKEVAGLLGRGKLVDAKTICALVMSGVV